MKFATVSKVLVVGWALLMASTALAATKGSLELKYPMSINGTTLKAGHYSLQWEGSGPTVEVSVMQGKTVVAKVPGKLVSLKDSAHAALLTQHNTDGTTDLRGVQFEGKKFTLELEQPKTSMEAAAK